MKTYDAAAGTLNGCYSCRVKECTQVLRWERLALSSEESWVYSGTEEEIYSQGYCDSCIGIQLQALDRLEKARLLETIDLAIGSEEGDWDE